MVLLFDLLKRKQASSESSADGTAAVPSDVDVAKRKVSRRPIGRDSAWAFASRLDVVDSPEPSARASRSGPTVQHGSDGGGSVGSSGRLLSASLSISRSSLGVFAPPARSSRGFFSTPFEDGPGGQSRAQSASSGRAMSLQEMGRIRQQESSTRYLPSSSLAASFSPRRSSLGGLELGSPQSAPRRLSSQLALIDDSDASGDEDEQDETVADLLGRFFVPPVSQLGKRLRAKSRMDRAKPGETNDQLNARGLKYRTHFVADTLPDEAISRLADGLIHGSSLQSSASSNRKKVAQGFKACAGIDGKTLVPKLATLAKFADFADCGGFDRGQPDARRANIFEDTIGAALAADYVTWEQARGFKHGVVDAAPSAYADLKFARDHLGLDAPDLKNDMVRAAAVRSVRVSEEAPDTRHAGSIPLCLQARREEYTNQNEGGGPEGGSDPVMVYVCCQIISFLFGLRRKELRSAMIKPTSDWRIIRLSFHPKGKPNKPRITAYRFAFGVCGHFAWWPRFYERFVGVPTLEPRFDTGKLFTASVIVSGVAPPGSTGGKDLLLSADSPIGLPLAVVTALFLTRHSDHGSICDVIRTFGVRLGYDVGTDCLVAGHWQGSSTSAGAGGRGAAPSHANTSRADAQRLRMVGRYGDQCVFSEGPDTIWRVLSVAYAAQRDCGLALTSLDPMSGWSEAQAAGSRRVAAGLTAWLDGEPPFPASRPEGWRFVPLV